NCHLGLEALAKTVPLALQVEVVLQIEPELFGSSEIPGQLEGRVGRERALPQHDLIDASGGDADVFGQVVLAQLQGLQELLHQSLAGMNRFKLATSHLAP